MSKPTTLTVTKLGAHVFCPGKADNTIASYALSKRGVSGREVVARIDVAPFADGFIANIVKKGTLRGWERAATAEEALVAATLVVEGRRDVSDDA